CGQSLGAGLTLRYALDHPDRIIAQVFTNTTSGLREIIDPAEDRKSAAWVAEGFLKEGSPGLEKIPVHPALSGAVWPMHPQDEPYRLHPLRGFCEGRTRSEELKQAGAS
ncbi:alpha/beta hydrolase, partial [Lacticaseibacillus rhamnosus]